MASFQLRYDLVEIYHNEVLGNGAFSKVCTAKYGQLSCAAKLLHAVFFQDPDIRTVITQFQRECQLVSTIRHPNIVQHLGTTRDPELGREILLMELMDETLTRCLERSAGPLPDRSQLSICHDVALALAYLHSNDIIHRDLSSENVLLIGEGSKAKLGGFGMAKQIGGTTPTTPLTPVPGTQLYMPPEAFNTSAIYYSGKLDCFSHGVLTLQIITRNYPKPGDGSTYVEDPGYPNGRAVVQFPEVERRKKDIDLVKPSHTLLPILLDCLKDRDTERPSADELCERLTHSKYTPSHSPSPNPMNHTERKVAEFESDLQRESDLQKESESKDWTKRIQELNTNLQEKEHEIQHAREQIQRLLEEIDAKNAELKKAKKFVREQDQSLQKKQQALVVYGYSVEQAREHIQRLHEEIDTKNAELERARHKLQIANEEKEHFEHIVLQHRSHLQESLKTIDLLCPDTSNTLSPSKSISTGDDHKVPQIPEGIQPSHEELYDALHPCRNDWMELGLRLGCDYPSLQNIKTKEHDAGTRLIAMTAEVLKRGDVDWNQVIQAVEKVGYTRQAQAIAEKVATLNF